MTRTDVSTNANDRPTAANAQRHGHTHEGVVSPSGTLPAPTTTHKGAERHDHETDMPYAKAAARQSVCGYLLVGKSDSQVCLSGRWAIRNRVPSQNTTEGGLRGEVSRTQLVVWVIALLSHTAKLTCGVLQYVRDSLLAIG